MEITSYRTWLTSAISEAERLHRIQTQSLQAAERAISESRSKLANAFERLATLQNDINNNLDGSDVPTTKTFKSSESSNHSKSNVVAIRKSNKKRSTTKKRA